MHIAGVRDVPETSQERVKCGLRGFDRSAAKAMMELLATALRDSKTGSVNLQVWVTNGILTRYNVRAEWGDVIDRPG